MSRIISRVLSVVDGSWNRRVPNDGISIGLRVVDLGLGVVDVGLREVVRLRDHAF